MKKLLLEPQPYFEPSCLLSCAWHSAAGVEWAGVCLHPQVDELASCQGPTSTSTSRAICWSCWHARGVGKAGTCQCTCVSLSSRRRTVVSKAAYAFASPGNCMNGFTWGYSLCLHLHSKLHSGVALHKDCHRPWWEKYARFSRSSQRGLWRALW